MRPVAYVALGFALVVAGCVAPPTEDTLAQGEQEIPALADALALLEAGEPAANIALLGEWRNGGSEIAAWGNLAFVMRGGAVSVLDITSLDNITELSTFDSGHDVQDVKVSADGKWAFVGDDNERSGPMLGPITKGTGGIHVYDVSDPAKPEHVSYQPVGERRGPHMVFYHVMPDGKEIVLGANADISIHTFDNTSGTLTEVARYSPDLVTDFNRDPQVFDVLYQGWAHDMFAMNEPDGTVLMYVANWDAGLRIVDITDPASPQELGGWNAFPDGDEGNLHTVSTAWIGDRRITVGSVEVGFSVVGGYHYAMGTDHSVLYIWDTTDPSSIQLVGTWDNPIDPTSGRDLEQLGEEVSSTHNFQLEDGRIYLAHYALGIWVLDISTPELQKEPAILGYYIEPDASTWDVILHNGVLFSSGTEGVLALHFATDVLGDLGIDSRA